MPGDDTPLTRDDIRDLTQALRETVVPLTSQMEGVLAREKSRDEQIQRMAASIERLTEAIRGGGSRDGLQTTQAVLETKVGTLEDRMDGLAAKGREAPNPDVLLEKIRTLEAEVTQAKANRNRITVSFWTSLVSVILSGILFLSLVALGFNP